MPSPAPVKPGTLRAEQIILFRIGEQLFALSSSSVQEVRSAFWAARRGRNSCVRAPQHPHRIAG